MAPTYYNNLEGLIQYVDIGKNDNLDLVRWKGRNSKVFPLDVLTARQNAKDEYFQHIEKSDYRMTYIKKNEIIFLISSDQNVQFQSLEAILEEVMKEFFEGYADIINDPVLLSGMVSSFTGFKSLIPETFNEAIQNRVKWLEVNCKICQNVKPICIRKTLVTESKSFPVSLVFEHEGHGLLIYIDRHFRLRGQEIVQISG